MADEIMTKIGYDLSKFPAITTTRVDPMAKAFDIVQRAESLDEAVRRFVARHHRQPPKPAAAASHVWAAANKASEGFSVTGT